MKMKYLVLGTLCLTLCAGTGWAKPKILDGSLAGWWRFDNSANYREDSSGYGGSINADISNGTPSSSGGYSGGKVNLAKPSTWGSAKSFTATLSNEAPAIPGTTYPYYTLAARFKSGGSITGDSGEVGQVVDDTSNWHFGCVRYQNKTSATYSTGSGSYTYATILDPRYRDSDNSWIKTDGTVDGDRKLELAATSSKFMMSYSGKTVTIGGQISGKKWYGDVDEVMVFVRMLTKRELSRLRYTGESYVYCYTGSPNFASKDNWSCNEYTCGYAPGGAFGVAYIVDNGLTMTQGGTATFGGDVSKHVSLTIGRKAALTFVDGNTEVTKSKLGNFNQNSAGTLTFYDLRLMNGKWTAAGTGLVTTLLDVDSPAGDVFDLYVTSSEFTFDAGGQVTGSGVLAKTGAGKLVLNNFTAAAGECPKVRLAAGSIKTPQLDGYTGGTVIVDGDAVTFTGADTLSGTIQVQYNGTIAAAEATYPVLNAPTLTSASQVAISATIPEKYEGTPKLENGVVSLVVTKKVAQLPDEDKGEKPVLLWQ